MHCNQPQGVLQRIDEQCAVSVYFQSALRSFGRAGPAWGATPFQLKHFAAEGLELSKGTPI
jgi:hypothetical protein